MVAPRRCHPRQRLTCPSAVRSAVTDEAMPVVGKGDDLFTQWLGCFVTLKNAGRLRGCIGMFVPDGPLQEMLPKMAYSAAQDPRFVADPITPKELEELTVDVSILSPLFETTEPDKLTIGMHGVFVVSGAQSGCFLPEVATEMGWDAEQFLSQCCSTKANLPTNAWRQPGAAVFLFTSEKISG